jgi:hypothetical protein
MAAGGLVVVVVVAVVKSEGLLERESRNEGKRMPGEFG